MNRWLLHKVSRQKYRKYAIRISIGVHVIMLIVIALLLLKSEVQVMEDKIAVELISELPRQIIKKKPIPIQKEEPPEPPEPEMPVPEENIPQRKKITLQKEVDVVQHKSSLEIAKLPASAAVDIQQPSSQNIDVDTPDLETPDLVTDARLEPTTDSILSPNVSAGESIDNAGVTKRSDTGVRSPSKGTGESIAGKVIETGAAEGTSQTGAGKNNGSGTGSRGDGSGDGSDTFSSIIEELTDDIIASSGGLPIDVVFVVDASGSMQDNINAVAEHLGQMTEAYKASEIDYQLGLTHFNADRPTQKTQVNTYQNHIVVFQLLRNLSIYKKRLYEIVPNGDENALDAIQQTLTRMEFRVNTIKHLIVVTDEPFTILEGKTVDTIIKLCKLNELYVNVLGRNMPDHKRLALETGGSWHAVPQDPMQQRMQTAQSHTATPQTIGSFILKDSINIPVDIILFIDSSKSMEDKVPYIKDQIDLWIHNWENANIDYRIGVVRFRAKQDVNMVNVFKPPQTEKKIHSILNLPYLGDENLIHAVKEGIQRLKLRPKAKTHFILITDEPGDPKYPVAGIIGLLKDFPVTVSVIGAADTFQISVASQTGGVYVKMPKAYKHSTPNE